MVRDGIAVIIPCYNEALTIGKVVDDFHRELPEATVYVYENNSTDGTAEIDSGSGFDGDSAEDLGETAEDSDAEPDDNDEEGGGDGDDYEEDDSMFADLF